MAFSFKGTDSEHTPVISRGVKRPSRVTDASRHHRVFTTVAAMNMLSHFPSLLRELTPRPTLFTPTHRPSDFSGVALGRRLSIPGMAVPPGCPAPVRRLMTCPALARDLPLAGDVGVVHQLAARHHRLVLNGERHLNGLP
jgi:hypothetical protein